MLNTSITKLNAIIIHNASINVLIVLSKVLQKLLHNDIKQSRAVFNPCSATQSYWYAAAYTDLFSVDQLLSNLILKRF